MWRAGCNDDGVARCNIETLLTQIHAPLTSEDVIDLLGYSMPMQLGLATGWNRGLGQTLILCPAGIWVQELANRGTILGDKTFYVF